MSPILTVIIPTYNVSTKIGRCFESLDALKSEISDIEIIFIDDCSTDSTLEMVEQYRSSRTTWVELVALDKNNGSPSKPRNIGLQNAIGKYVFHLDPDDEILPAGIIRSIDVAERTDADMVRAPLIRFDGTETIVMNELKDWDELVTEQDKRASIVKNLSTTVCAVYRRDFLRDNNILWPEDLRLAEDAIFLYKVISVGKVEYSPEPDFKYHVSFDNSAASSTQQYEDRELVNHLTAWKRSSEILAKANVDYMALRGQVAMQTAFQNMIRFNHSGFEKENLIAFHEFLKEHEIAVKKYSYGKRFSQLVQLLMEGKFTEFLEAIKLRLLIAGYDLRFILPAVPYLAEHYQVAVDEWTGHQQHDERNSQRLLNWADVIHCEWMLGNSVWYSENKLDRQTIQIRLHRFETDQDYGNQLNRSAVDRYITIAPYMFEEMQERFLFPREKVCYAPNYIEVDKYKTSQSPDKVFNLCMVGSIPIRKGYKRALELISMLHQIDSRYTLTVYGRRPDELSWVINDPAERQYFSECERFVRQQGLETVVKFEGWVDTKEALADKGFVLSLSDAEGSHVAAAEGFAAKNITLLRPWEGAEFMYPDKYIFDSLEEMRDYVLECRDFETFNSRAKDGHDYVASRYSMSNFIRNFIDFLPVPTRVV